MSGAAIVYTASGPSGTRYADVRLRIVAQRIQGHPDQDKLKTVIQVPGIPEDPLAEQFLTPLELAEWISESRRQGWSLEAAA